MSPKIKEMAPVIWDAIGQSKKILLHCHPNPDQDSIGSALAFYHLAKSLGKEAVVIAGDSPIPDFAQFMPGHEAIEPKNFFDIDINNFDTFFALDISSLNRLSSLGPVQLPAQLKTVVIDHHRGDGAFGQINLVEPTYPATAQILFDLFTVWGVKLDYNMAANLFLGLYYDTGGFKYEGTSAYSLKVAAELAELVSDFSTIVSAIDGSNKPETVVYQRLMLDSLEIVNKKMALVSASYQDLLQAGLSTETASAPGSPVSDLLLAVKDWEVVITLVEKEPGQVRISLRARPDKVWDVSKIAMALGGGGHRLAAGTRIMGTVSEAKAKLLKTIAQIYPDLAGT